jgi:hypothetical protein
MPKAPCRNIAYQTTLGITGRILAAPVLVYGGVNVSQHTLPTYEFELDTAVAAGDESVTLALVNPPAGVTQVSLDVGTVLEFPGATPTAPKIRVTLAESTPVNVTTTAAKFDTMPINLPIAAGAIAEDKALLYLPGLRNGVVTPTIKAEETTNYGSGSGTEMLTVGNAKKLNGELDLAYNNAAHDLILKFLYDDDYIGREAYMEIAFPHGEKHEGYALLTTATPQANVQAKRSLTFEMNFQGGCYRYTAAPLIPA